MQNTRDTIEATAEVVCNNSAITERDWLEYRRMGLGGSDVAGAAGLSPWESPYSVWAKKLGLVPDKVENERMKWGKRLEEAIGMGMAEDVGLAIERYPYMLRSKEHPIAQTNLDFISERGVVEVKNTGWRMGVHWEDGSCPDFYALQGQHELLVGGLGMTDFFVLVDGGLGVHVAMERNDSLIHDLTTIERDFWRLVESNTPPAVDGSDSTTQALKGRFASPEPDSEVELPLTTLERIGQLKELKATIKAAQTDIDLIENELRELLGDHERGLVDGMEVITYKLTERAEYTVAAGSYRRFNFKTAKPRRTN